MSLTLYSMPSSGNSYKVRLLLALMGREYTHIGLENDSDALTKAHSDGLLPLGKLPVLELANGTQIPESNAILCYLADGTDWLPDDNLDRARVLGWMFFEQNRHETVIAVRAALREYASRAHLATPERMASLLAEGHAVLKIMDEHLSERDWLVGGSPTVADVSLYAYTHTADSRGGFDMTQFPAINAWVERMSKLPGYVRLNGIPQ
ncbi:MAG: glutathione S-transferase family protein [Boseongicola sp.]